MALASRLKYFEDAKLGRVFIGSTAAAGVALPVETGTAVTFGVWNVTTNKYAVPLWISMAYVSGTITVGGFGLANQDVGYATGTAAPLSAFTNGTPKNALLGAGDASAMRFTPSAATLSAGGTRCYLLGSAHEIATAGPGVSTIHHDFDGSLIVRPGQLLFPCYSIAQTGVFSISMGWAEVDI
jgi:hypothetical protein